MAKQTNVAEPVILRHKSLRQCAAVRTQIAVRLIQADAADANWIRTSKLKSVLWRCSVYRVHVRWHCTDILRLHRSCVARATRPSSVIQLRLGNVQNVAGTNAVQQNPATWVTLATLLQTPPTVSQTTATPMLSTVALVHCIRVQQSSRIYVRLPYMYVCTTLWPSFCIEDMGLNNLTARWLTFIKSHHDKTKLHPTHPLREFNSCTLCKNMCIKYDKL